MIKDFLFSFFLSISLGAFILIGGLIFDHHFFSHCEKWEKEVRWNKGEVSGYICV